MEATATDRDALAWHRHSYGVPARRGMRVKIDGKLGTIIGASGPHVRVRLDEPIRTAHGGRLLRVGCHPTWRMDYLDGEGERHA